MLSAQGQNTKMFLSVVSLREPIDVHKYHTLLISFNIIEARARRVLAPQRAAFEKSPEGLPFLSTPRRFSWGVSFVFLALPPPGPTLASPRQQ